MRPINKSTRSFPLSVGKRINTRLKAPAGRGGGGGGGGYECRGGTGEKIAA